MSRIIFSLLTLVSFGFFGYTCYRIYRYFTLTKKAYPIKNIGERINLTLLVAFGQSKILRKPIAGLMHALVYWGFLVITIGTVEMMIDGIAGTQRTLSVFGIGYNVITASEDIFALLVTVACVVFLIRRYITKPKRFTGIEMKPSSRQDATFILSLILLLMISLMGMNASYLAQGRTEYYGVFPVSSMFSDFVSGIFSDSLHAFEKTNWWIHITVIYFFLNYLPFSKHFHVISSVPNVFLSRLTPKGKLNSLETVTKEVKLMLHPADNSGGVNPSEVSTETQTASVPIRFGVKDAEDYSWKNLLDAYTCTECGRCTAVCPANITGKKLSPRKLYIDARHRMAEKAEGLLNDRNFSDGRALIGNYISEEELWACTTCGACIQECPVNIDHVPFIIDMRRYLVMEESKMPSALQTMMTNIENNGAPWAFPASDRFNWAEGLNIPTMAEMNAKGEQPEVLFWVGCAGSFDDRYKKVTRAFAQILQKANVKFAVLGLEETCTGDPAKRAGNEFLAQMQAMTNISTLNNYSVKKIVTACPHCFNTIKNEYPDLGGNYEVMHHSQFLQKLIEEGKVRIFDGENVKSKSITFHDSCYLGRANNVYDAPRKVLESLNTEIIEMKRSRTRGLCCGAGGAQMFKEDEPGKKKVNIERIEEALDTNANIVASACPFCMTMLTDGVKEKEKQNDVKMFDIAELIAQAEGIK